MDANIELRIEHLILHDVPAHQRHQIAAAIERALTQLLADQGLPGDRSNHALTLDSSLIEISAGTQPDAIAAQVAQSIYSQMAPGQSLTGVTGRSNR